MPHLHTPHRKRLSTEWTMKVLEVGYTCEIWGSHTWITEYSGLLDRNATLTSKWLLTFWIIGNSLPFDMA